MMYKLFSPKFLPIILGKKYEQKNIISKMIGFSYPRADLVLAPLDVCSLHTMHQMQQCHCSDAAAMVEEVDGDLPPPKSTNRYYGQLLKKGA